MTPTRARLEELLGTEATQKLTAAEEAELDALLVAFPDQDPDAFELAAAAVHLALLDPTEEMPTSLAEKLHLTAVALAPSPARPRRAPPAWAGWAVAAGLAGVAVWALWLKPPAERIVVERVEVPVPGKLPPEPTLEQKRDAIRPAAKTFTDAKNNASASVVWSDRKQEGYLEVRGLAANDPNKERYQLWIVDASRKGEKPISGGLFDVKPDGTALVRVDPSLPIGDAAAFAITKEIPGGVVESKGPMLLVMPKPG